MGLATLKTGKYNKNIFEGKKNSVVRLKKRLLTIQKKKRCADVTDSDSASSSSVVLESDIVLVVLDVVARLAVDVVATGFWLKDIATELFAVSTENENGFPVDDWPLDDEPKLNP